MTDSYFNVYKVYKCLHMYLKDKLYNLGIFKKSNKMKNFSIRDQEVRVFQEMKGFEEIMDTDLLASCLKTEEE